MGRHVPGQPYRYKHGWIPVAAAEYKESGGFTIDRNGHEPKTGYMVSLAGHESSRPAAEFAKAPEKFIDQHASEHADSLRQPGNFHGAWTDDGQTFLDVSHNHPDVRSAAHAALVNRQLAVADMEKITAGEFGTAFPTTEDITLKAIKTLKKGDDEVQLGDFHVSRAVSNGRHVTVSRPGGGPIEVTPKEAAQMIADHHKHKSKDTSLSFITPTLHGEVTDLSQKGGRLAFWKQILPKKQIDYTAKDGSRQKLVFDDAYLHDLANNKAVDKIGFLLADVNNAHTMDPERWRGDVVKMEVRDDGLYGKIVFPSVEAAQAVLANPDLGVSARIREGVQRSDGSTVSRGIIHVLGTLDPQVSGMTPWEPTDLSADQGEVLDLSDKEYEDMADKTKTEVKALDEYTEADIEAFTDEELDAFLAAYAPEALDYTGADDLEVEDDEDLEDLNDDEPVLVGAGADMSAKAVKDIELANQRADSANARADEALRRVADAEWKQTKDSLLSAGVPVAAIDLAAPVLNRADDMVIDLSNTDQADINVSKVVRDLLDQMKGMVDLSVEQGHTGHFRSGDGEDPDAEILARWDI